MKTRKKKRAPSPGPGALTLDKDYVSTLFLASFNGECLLGGFRIRRGIIVSFYR